MPNDCNEQDSLKASPDGEGLRPIEVTIMANNMIRAIATIALALTACGTKLHVAKNATLPKKFIIPLGGKVEDTKGFAWKGKPGSWAESGYITDPAEIELHLPNGNVFTTNSECTSAVQKRGIITCIDVTPLSGLVTLESGVQHAQDIAKALHVDHELVAQFREWEGRTDEFSRDFGADLPGGAALNGHVKLHSSGRGWYISLEFVSKEFWSESPKSK
jgi:hypothetical protein